MERKIFIEIPMLEVGDWSGNLVGCTKSFEVTILEAKKILESLQEAIPIVEEYIRLDKIQRIAELESELKQLKEEL